MYVIPMKEKSKLIFLFYGLIFMTCIFHIIVYLHLDIYPNKADPFVNKPDPTTVINILETIASVSMLALGYDAPDFILNQSHFQPNSKRKSKEVHEIYVRLCILLGHCIIRRRLYLYLGI